MTNGLRESIMRYGRIDAAGLAIALALTAAAYGLQIRPLICANQNVSRQAAELIVQEHKASQLRTQLRSLQDQLAASQQMMDRNGIRLQPASHLNQRIARLTDLAGESGLQIDSVEPGKVTNAARYRMMNIRLTGRGSYRSCVDFLKRLSDTVRDSSMDKMRLSAQAVATEPMPAFTFDLIWYMAPEEISSKR